MRTNYQCKLVWSLWNGILLLHRHKIHIHAFVHTPSSPMVSPFTNLHQHRDSWSTRQHSPLLSDVSSVLSLSSNMNDDDDDEDEDEEKHRTKDFGRIHSDRRWIVQSIFYGICLNNFCIWKSASANASEVDPCKDGIIVAESAVPGAYQQMCMQLPERTISLKSTGDRLTILQGTNNANGGTVSGRTGVAVWNSCLLLSRLLDILGSDILKGKVVLELGCGAGLASLVAAKLGATKVFATDGNDEVINLAKANIDTNQLSSLVQATKLQWGILDASDYSDTAEIVMGSDLTYNAGTWRVLAETVVSILRPGGVFVYLSLGHQGFNVAGEMDGFLTVAQNVGLVELTTKNDVWPFQGGAGFLTKALLDCISKDEKAILEATGGVKVLLLTRK